MKASFIDFRRTPKLIARALASGREVQLYYRGHLAGVISPARRVLRRHRPPAKADPARGMWADRPDMRNPATFVRRLRERRWHAL
jgi:poly(3-hydroxyalkanoate) synthetase